MLFLGFGVELGVVDAHHWAVVYSGEDVDLSQQIDIFLALKSLIWDLKLFAFDRII